MQAILKTHFKLNENYEYELISLEIAGKKTHFGKILSVKEDTIYFVDDLNILYTYLIKFLLDNNIKFDYSYKNGKCANLKVKFDNKNIFFVNFKTKFGVDFDFKNNENNEILIEYARKNGYDKMSLGADAYKEFLNTIFKPKPYHENANYNLIREDFPIFDYDEMLLEAKKNVYGFQFVKSGNYNNIFEYDISGAYPASAFNDLPTGLPFYFNNIEDVPKSYFKIIKFSFYDCSLKQNGINFLNVSHLGQLTLTERLFEAFKKNYDAKIKIKKIEAFKTRKSQLANFLNNTVIKGKQLEQNKRIASYNKVLGNSLIGYLGRNTITYKNTAKLTQQGIIYDNIEQKIDPIYLPAYLCILDSAKSKFLKAIKPYFNDIIYANTDGFLISKQLNLDILNLQNANSIVGNFKEKHHFKEIHIQCINGYSAITTDAELVNVISGMSFEETLTPEQYRTKNFSYYLNIPTSNGTIKKQIIKLNSQQAVC